MSWKALMIPQTVPNSPTKGAVAPIVPSTQTWLFSRSDTCCRSRSTAETTASNEVRPCRENPARKMSATTERDRSHALRASSTSPRNRCRETISPNALACPPTLQSATSRSTATPSANTEHARMTAMATPPRRIK